MITYGNGEVLFDGNANGFEMKYKGSISVESNHDNLLVSVSKNKIVGLMIDGTSLPLELFTYQGELRLLSCKTTEGTTLDRERITLQGVDYWELDGEKWEDDGSLWGTRDGTYLVGSRQRYDKKKIVINNNIRTQSEGQYQYKDGSPVAANELIHIHGDGSAMTGAVHTKDSVHIYPIKERVQITRRQISQIRRATTPATSSSGGSGGGGY